MSVTRPFSLISETAVETAALDVPFFVDWLTVSQVHPAGGLPLVDSGAVWAADADGVVEWRTVRRHMHEGSHETSVAVRCDGFRVELSGNLSRFGRQDNVFGFGLIECLSRANAILAHYGLPPFTAGSAFQVVKPGRGYLETRWTGARISRIDLTANYSAGSADDAHAVMQWLGSQHAPRKAGRVLGQGETVDWGAGSRRVYAKAYLKGLELARRGAPERLVSWATESGLVRFEVTLKSNALTDLGLCWLGEYVVGSKGWAMGELVRLFEEQTSVLTRAQRADDDLSALPRALRGVARDYLAGADLVRDLPRSTFYRHRRALLPYGLDISVRNVRPFVPRVRVVQLAAAEVPFWYSLAA